jgi:hypothetical protein
MNTGCVVGNPYLGIISGLPMMRPEFCSVGRSRFIELDCRVTVAWNPYLPLVFAAIGVDSVLVTL